jgi:hypothetical protein
MITLRFPTADDGSSNNYYHLCIAAPEAQSTRLSSLDSRFPGSPALAG